MPGVCHSVNADNEQGAYEAVKYLIGKGHRRIALITHARWKWMPRCGPV